MQKILRIGFCGSASFSLPFLKSLAESKQIEVACVLTKPDKRAQRGQKIISNPVKYFAEKHSIPILEPERLNNIEAQNRLRNQLNYFQIDVVVVVAYGLMIPAALLNVVQMGWINVHASLLPRWKGASPIIQTILSGDEESGISVMKIDEGMDTGPIGLQKTCEITPEETAQSLQRKLEKIGVLGLHEILQQLLLDPKSVFWKQQTSTGTYTQKVNKVDAQIHWSDSALNIDRKVRAYMPSPIAWWSCHGERVRLIKTSVLSTFNEKSGFSPGDVCANDQTSLSVQTGQGILKCAQLQFESRNVQNWTDLRNQKRTKQWQPGYSLIGPPIRK